MKKLLAFTLLFLALTGTAAASCTSPNGGTGSLNWNGSAYQQCNGTTWISVLADGGGNTASIISSTNLYGGSISGTTGTFGSIGSGLINATGISITTNQTSVTTLYASGNVSIGKTSPATALEVNGTVSATIGTIPIGATMTFAGSTAPSGWVLCYGQAISRTTYAALFAVISTTYGAGDGSTTFNLPDMRGRTVAGVDNMGGSAASRITVTNNFTASLGASGGGEATTLSFANLPPNGTDGGYVFVRNSGAVYSITNSGGVGMDRSNGSDTPFTNLPPTIIQNYIIFAGK